MARRKGQGLLAHHCLRARSALPSRPTALFKSLLASTKLAALIKPLHMLADTSSSHRWRRKECPFMCWQPWLFTTTSAPQWSTYMPMSRSCGLRWSWFEYIGFGAAFTGAIGIALLQRTTHSLAILSSYQI